MLIVVKSTQLAISIIPEKAQRQTRQIVYGMIVLDSRVSKASITNERAKGKGKGNKAAILGYVL